MGHYRSSESLREAEATGGGVVGDLSPLFFLRSRGERKKGVFDSISTDRCARDVRRGGGIWRGMGRE